jgi:cytochrome c556
MRLASLAFVAAAAGLLVAATADPKAQVAARQAGMKQVGRTFKGINDQLHGAHDAGTLKAQTHELAELAKRAHSWFPKGSGAEAGVKTAAKAEIWTNRRDFDAKAAAFAKASLALSNAAARSSDPAVLGPLAGQVGGACKGCHTTYKLSDH